METTYKAKFIYEDRSTETLFCSRKEAIEIKNILSGVAFLQVLVCLK